MTTIQLRKEEQANPIASEVSALIAVVRPILTAILYGLKTDIVEQVGGHAKVTLSILPRLYRPGDGDVGICFEWAIHDAIRRADGKVLDRIQSALTFCRVPGVDPASILFGAEKSGALQLIDTASQILTDDSRLLTGEQAQPPKLKRHLSMLAAAFRRPETRRYLPYSIAGLWKADLFVGNSDSDRWVGTSVKINPRDLEGARGLRIGIVPESQGNSDRITKDDAKNLIVCPIPYDASFMEVFYTGWRIVQQFIRADAKMPKDVALPNPPERQVARELVDRAKFTVLEVVEALAAQEQPHLLSGSQKDASLSSALDTGVGITNTIIAPVSKLD